MSKVFFLKAAMAMAIVTPWLTRTAMAFSIHHHQGHASSHGPTYKTTRQSLVWASNENDNGSTTTATGVKTAATNDAEKWREQAQKLRDEIAQAEQQQQQQQQQKEQESETTAKTTATAASQKTKTPNKSKQSPWSLNNDNDTLNAYRLYIDIGREDGTWMDPRWGASGRRLEFTVDVQFTPELATAQDILNQMVPDNQASNPKSPTYQLATAPQARLRQGFDQMPCETVSGYRLDHGNNNKKNQNTASSTLRFFILPTNGKQEGDIVLAAGAPLYFSLPVFRGNNNRATMPSSLLLSRKQGIVSVRQKGWHTGWLRDESRIVGVFRAVPLDEARVKDGF